MTRKLFIVCLLSLFFIRMKAQPYGNEWINYSQSYYKIPIAQNGIYRIDSAALANSGIPLSSIDPRSFQLFKGGKQQYVFVNGESDGAFNSGDYVEFYGEKNDGSMDTLLYKNTPFLPNPYYSLVNDTAVYFLTWNSAITNNRVLPDNDTTFSSYLPAVPYFLNDAVLSLSDTYYDGETDAAGGTDARYLRSEGWFGNAINMGGSASYTVATPLVYTAGPNARIEATAVGASRDITLVPALPDHHLKIQANSIAVADTLFKGYDENRFIISVPPTAIAATASSSSSLSFIFTSIADPGFSSNRTAVSYMHVTYPHTVDMEGKTHFLFSLTDNPSAPKSLLDISNFSGSGNVFVYDLAAHLRISAVPFASNYKVLVANGGLKKCFIYSDGDVINVTSLLPVTASAKFTNYAATSVDSAYLIITHKSLMASALNYKTYRTADIFGGGHNVIIADIDELYDQFAYGIVKSPLSIRGFADLMLDTNPSAPPQDLFLVGKSVHLSYIRQDAVYYPTDLVPSFGNPSSDNLLTAGLNGTWLRPAIPTGRLAARNAAEVDLYLNKVSQYENRASNPPAEWMKQVLHFGGGITALEQLTYKAYLANYENTVENIKYGGHVKSFFKTSSLPIEINTSDTLHQLLDEGVSLMTFFGHASGTGFDQSIDDVNSYNPLPGHYPFLLANSCFAGDLHSPDYSAFGYPRSSSETYVLTANKGMIGYLGSVGLGVPYALNYFSTAFYSRFSNVSYGENIGSIIKSTIGDLEPVASIDSIARETCYQMTLHGDPALKINMHALPDYKITSSDVSFNLAATDSFTVSVVRTNVGKASGDSIFTEVIRTFPNGDTVHYLSSRSPSPYFRDTISFRIPYDFSHDVGLNKIVVMLDSYDEVTELSETNNTTGEIDLLINGGAIVPVFPYEFAIVPRDTVTLRATTADPFAASRNYIFEVDTTDQFNSPFLQSSVITSPGGVVSWHLPFSLAGNRVYYWRVSPDSIDATGYSWRESSFQYIMNKRGWEQAHLFQFKNDGFQFVRLNRPSRRFDFVNDLKTIQCIDGIYPYMVWTEIVWKMNSTVKTYWNCNTTYEAFNVAVLDSVTLNNWTTSIDPASTCSNCTNGPYGNAICRTYPMNSFDFLTNTPAHRLNLSNFIDSIPVGDYVLMYSMNHQYMPSYEPSFRQAFKNIGSGTIDSLAPNVPYIIFGRKGAVSGTAKEIAGDSVNSIIQLDTALNTNWNEGYIASPVIGPATSWDSLSWQQHTLDGAQTADSIVVRVIGIKPDGSENTLADFGMSQMDISNLSAYANAAIYPRMRLVAYMKDDSLHTPPQLDRWQVIYTPVPEAAVNPPLGYAINSSSLQEGEDLHVSLPIQNISDLQFADSMLVTAWIEDQNRVSHPLGSRLLRDSLQPGEVIIDTLSLSTVGYAGSNALWIEANQSGQAHSQLEQYHFNNIVRIPFTVSSDHINPLLDVTFDGIHILNNDIVSARPDILIRLKDENQFLALNDTADFKVFVKKPSSSLAQRIYFGSSMSFYPAVLPNNSCKINYTPELTDDGSYQLIVQARDKSDNESGSIDYKINFEVVNKATITEVMNYPNPFSTSTRFVFTLTGSAVPEIFKIQIMTITGKVVREIFQDELGSLHIGRNITDYAWDGRDMFGDQLANGVYLYHVVTRLNGESIEKRESGADEYFRKGWGKMYLMK